MMRFREPVRQAELQLKLVPVAQLCIPEAGQRALSSSLVKKLLYSIAEAGFLVPLIVVESEDSTYEVLDGQHRLEALKQALPPNSSAEVPCIVLPREHRNKALLALNREKADSVRDKLQKLRSMLGQFAQSNQTEAEFFASIVLDEHYLVPMAHAGLQSPSLVEGIAKSFARPLMDAPASEAVPIRQREAKLLEELEAAVNEVAYSYGINDFTLRKAIISKAKQELWGRRRVIEETLETAVPKLIEVIKAKDWSFLGG